MIFNNWFSNRRRVATTRMQTSNTRHPDGTSIDGRYFKDDRLSDLSSNTVRNSIWHTGDFRLAASLVILQPSSRKVVLVHDTRTGAWFLPRGRKDVGESLEQTALREGYEEVRTSKLKY